MMAEKRMLMDLAHASDQTITDVLKIYPYPVIVSHTGVRGVCDNPRNLTDDQIMKIADQGGIIGVGYFKQAVCSKDVSGIVRTIRYITDLVGVGHAALGSDWDGSVITAIDAGRLIDITEALIRDGYSETEIRLIMGENALRVIMDTLAPGNPLPSTLFF
jgi:membrane dipeptidase